MNQAQRVLKLLTLFQKHDRLCTPQIAEIFNTNTRTVQRDLEILAEFLGDKLLNPSRGCYALQNRKELFAYLKDDVKLKEFFEFIALFDAKLLSIFDTRQFPIIEQVKKDVATLYHIAEKPIEQLDANKLKPIKEAIKLRRRTTVRYTDRDAKTKRFENLKPIKIVFAEGNWYLAAVTQEEQNGGFKFLRINFIKEFNLLAHTFQRDIDAEDFIKRFQSLFQSYKIPSYDITLEIDRTIARYFKVKKHLKSQKIIKEKENGALLVSYTVNNEMEILPLIKKWIPRIRILSPESLKKRMKEDINRYLSTLE